MRARAISFIGSLREIDVPTGSSARSRILKSMRNASGSLRRDRARPMRRPHLHRAEDARKLAQLLLEHCLLHSKKGASLTSYRDFGASRSPTLSTPSRRARTRCSTVSTLTPSRTRHEESRVSHEPARTGSAGTERSAGGTDHGVRRRRAQRHPGFATRLQARPNAGAFSACVGGAWSEGAGSRWGVARLAERGL